jgi:hypothetical protein
MLVWLGLTGLTSLLRVQRDGDPKGGGHRRRAEGEVKECKAVAVADMDSRVKHWQRLMLTWRE